MKKFTLLIAILLLCVASLFAQAPEKFNYQAVVRNASNALVTNAPVGVRVSILQGSAAGNAVYVETHTVTTNANGLMTVEIGGGTVQQGSFAGIDWANGPFFLKTETDPAGGASYSITSTQQLMSVPYALYAGEAANGFSGDYNDLTNRPQNVSQLTNDAGYITLNQVPAQVNADWNATDGPAEILNKPTNADFGQGIVRNKVNNPSGETDITVNFSTYQLVNGGVVSLVFTRAVPEGATLNINSMGAKPIYYHEAPLTAGTIKANDRCLFMYNGPAERYYLIAIDRWGVDLDALATVAHTGDYNDLSNKPTIPTVPTNISAFVNDAGYITAIPDSFGGISLESDPIFSAWNKDYNDLINKPTNADFGQGIVRNKVNNPSGATEIAVTFTTYQLVNGGVISLAFTRAVPEGASLNINSMGAKPIYYHEAALPAGTIKANDRCLFMYNSSADRYYLIAIDRWGVDLDALATVAHTGNYNDLTNKPNLAPVATSGNYNDLTNKPTIPTVPTNVSAFVNDAGYLTAIPDSLGGISIESDPIFSAWNKDYNDLINKPTNADFGHGVVRNKVNNPSGATDIAANFSTYQLVNGGVVSLAFVHAVPAGATLNINNMGAKPIYYHDAPLTAGVIKADDRCLFMYNGPAERYYLIAIDRWGVDLDALATVAHTGSYNDLIDKPNLFSGNYNDLTNKPVIPTVPTNISAFVNDMGYLTSIPDSLGGIGTETDPVFTAWDKDYNDLTNLPTNADFGQGIVRNKVNNLSGETDITVNFSTYQLVNGGVVALAFTRAVPEGATLNINNKGAKPIYYHEVPLTAGLIKANDRCLFMYNGPAERYYLIAIDRWGADIDALATVAHTGDYNDLTNKPTIPTQLSQLNNNVGYITASDIPAQQNADWNATSGAAQILHKPNLAPVATSGNYNDLTNQPTNADFGQGIVRNKVNNLAGETDITVNFSTYALENGGVVSLVFTRAVPEGATLNINNKGAKPIYYHEVPLTAGIIKANDRCLFMYNGPAERYYLIAIDRWGADLDALATVAHTGNYNDLANKPTIPTTTSQLTNDAGFITSSQVAAAQVNADWTATSGAAKILHKPELAPVATSGNYNDLTNKPTIPTVPTNVSAFLNDAGYLTAIPDSFGGISVEADPIFSAWDKDYNDLINTPTNADFGQGIVRYKVDNPAGEANIAVTFSGYKLVDGGVVALSFTRDVPAYATLNINEKGAKSIYYRGAALTANVIKASDRCLFMYNGSTGRYYLLANDRWGADVDALATVAHTGSYNDLIDKPSFGIVALTNNYNDLTDKPENLSQFYNDEHFITTDDIPAQVQADWEQTDDTQPDYIRNKPDMNQYLTSADMSDYLTEADMSNYVTKTEDESIGGDKTFTDNVTIAATGSLEVPSVLNSIGTDGSLNVNGSGNCEQAVNFCDLETLYKSLLAKIDNLQDSIHKLSLPQDGAPCPNTPNVVDYDGNTYSTVRIGNQCWMRENLRVTHWPNGTAISSSSNVTSYGIKAGYRYVFTDVMANSSASATSSITQGICPNGWRVPSDNDFTELVSYANLKCGNAAKSLMSPYGWGSSETGQNVLGMSLEPNWSGDCDLVSTNASDWRLSSTISDIHNVGTYSSYSLGVRCIRSNSNGEPNSSPVTAAPSVTTYASTIALISNGETDVTIMPGAIVNDGGGITKYGMVYSTSASSSSTLQIGKTGVTDSSRTLNKTDLELPFVMPSFHLTGFSTGTTVYYRAYATNPEGTTYGNVMHFTTQANPKSCKSVMGPSYPENVTNNGITYPTVAIGTGASAQCWMAQNLRNTSYADGGYLSGYYYNPNGGSLSPEYGRLYNWASVMRGTASTTLPVQGICPTGWHVPSASEFNTMKTTLQSNSAMYCNSSSNIAKALASQNGWIPSSTTCTPGNDMLSNNASGFNAYPTGDKTSSGYLMYGERTFFWHTGCGFYYLSSDNATFTLQNSTDPTYAFPVRCILGNSAPTVSTSTTTPTVTYNTANSVGGNVHSSGGTSITYCGIVYSSSVTTPTVTSSGGASSNCHRVSATAGTGSFTKSLTGLSANTTYYYRAYAINSTGTTYGEVKTFTTSTVKTISNYSGYGLELSRTSARLGAAITDGQTSETIQCWGFMLYEKSNGTYTKVLDVCSTTSGGGSQTGSDGRTYSYYLNSTPSPDGHFSMYVYGLKPGTTYAYKAQMSTDVQGWVYANTYSSDFTTYFTPSVSTGTASYSGSGRSFSFPGTLSSLGNPSCTEWGVLVGTSTSTPTITNSSFNKFSWSNPTSTGTNTRSLILNAAGATYYYRFYAINKSGVNNTDTVVYGSIKSITTPTAPSLNGHNGFTAEGGLSPYYYSANVTRYSITQKSYFVDGGSPFTAAGLLYTTNSSLANNTPTSSTISTSASEAATKWVQVNSTSSLSTHTPTTITGLSSNTTYYIRSFATNAYGTTYSSAYRAVKTAVNCNSSSSTYNTLTDQSGYTYETVIIGSQCWMKSNLRAKRFDDKEIFGDGTTITQKATGDANNMSSTIPYYYYPNGSSSNASSHGYLYNWAAATGNGISNYGGGSNMTTSQGKKQGACPRGWHIPTETELNTLNQLFSGTNATTNWLAFTNSKFAGTVSSNGTVSNYNILGNYWSTTLVTGTSYYYLYTKNDGSHSVSTGWGANGAISVRCVQDISY